MDPVIVPIDTSQKLTTEQIAIITSTGNIKVNAVAGSGKTTTIIEYARARPKTARILYLAYNKSVKSEAQKRFASAGLNNVRVETAHSLAYKHIVPPHGYSVRKTDYKTYEVAEILGLSNHGEQHGEYVLANHISKFATFFCNSDKHKVQELNYLDTIADAKARTFVKNYYHAIENGARHFLKKMDKGEIEITHDFYLKKFQLKKNLVLPFDYILFDEGQDASPAMLDIFLRQTATRVIVGDSHQQIYAWRHAVNSLQSVDFPSYELTVSFRFNQAIAHLSMNILSWKKYLGLPCDPTITGFGSNSATICKAILARTNLGLLIRAITYIKEHPEVNRIYFEGNFSSYTYADDGASLYDVFNLYYENHALIKDKLIKSMNNFQELEDYIEKTDDVQLAMMAEITKEYKTDVPSLIQSLKSKQVSTDERDKAAMIFSTVHKSKGMEYDAVQLVEDFITEPKLERLAAEKNDEEELDFKKWNEEINLLYVAITRTKNILRIPENLLPKQHPFAKNIHIIRNKKPDPPTANLTGPIPISDRAKSPHLDIKTNHTTNHLKTTRKDHRQAYKPWSSESDVELKMLYYKGTPLPTITSHFGRTSGAILSRLKKIGCVHFE